MARLGQTYLVDMTSRIIDSRLNWQGKNQNHMFGGVSEKASAESDGDGDIDEPGNVGDEIDGGSANVSESRSKPCFLSQSMHGSKRHLRDLARNAIAIVSEFDGPSLFITATCNPLWPEIQEALLPGQSAFDRPDVVCRVFKHRLAALLANLRVDKYFKGRVIYEISVIEYQHRGLPHAHIVIKLDGVPMAAQPDLASAWVDANITAKMPIITETSTAKDREYAHLVETHMTHKCANAVNGCLDDNNHCKKGYHSNVLIPIKTFDVKGFPKYQRFHEADLKVVPHNRLALLDWGDHLNIEFAGSSKAILYLYKVSLYRYY